MGHFKDLTGKKFNRLTVICFDHKNKDGKSYWKCRCNCGNVIIIQGYCISSGITKSCGCLNKELASKRNSTHRKTHTRLYRIWAGVKYRCCNPKAVGYNLYGGRGITICDEWREFIPFYEWAMANGYADNLTIDRIDVNGNYEPSNCRWATPKEQSNNTRRNRKLTYNGKTQTIAQWADETGIKSKTIARRIDFLKWDIKRTLTTP